MINNNWENMCRICGRQEMGSNCNNANCDGDDIEGPCMNKYHDFIPPILDCIEHWEKCVLECHDDHGCKNP